MTAPRRLHYDTGDRRQWKVKLGGTVRVMTELRPACGRWLLDSDKLTTDRALVTCGHCTVAINRHNGSDDDGEAGE